MREAIASVDHSEWAFDKIVI